MPGRDLTPSEKIDQEYERMIQTGAAMIILTLFLAGAFLGLTNEPPDPDAEVILYYNERVHTDPKFENEGFTRDTKEPRVFEPKLLKQRQQHLKSEDDENLANSGKYKVDDE